MVISIDSLHDTPLITVSNILYRLWGLRCMLDECTLWMYTVCPCSVIFVWKTAHIASLEKKKKKKKKKSGMLRLTPNSLAVSDIGQKVLGFTHPVHRAYCRIEKTHNWITNNSFYMYRYKLTWGWKWGSGYEERKMTDEEKRTGWGWEWGDQSLVGVMQPLVHILGQV